MRLVKSLITLLMICSCAVASARADESPSPPTPPQQNEPWTPPETRLPRFMVSAAEALFEQGLGDPRGCRYRSIRIQLADAQGKRKDVSTAGWVLPEPNGGRPRFAVAWSGLVHPLLDVGGAIDLDRDIADIPPEGQWPADRGGAQWANMRGRGDGNSNDETKAASLDMFHPIQVCLLLRLGRADLAETLWTRAGKPLAPKPRGSGPALDLRTYGISYMSMAESFAWFRYSRAIRAHQEGEDAQALAEFRALETLGAAVDAKAAELGFIVPNWYGNFPPPQREPVFQYLIFLGQLPALLADQERRAAERASPPLPPAEGDKIATLIRELDQIASENVGMNIARFPNFQGGNDSPTIKALIDLGDDAVEPLIEVIRSDDRLTRSIDMRRGGAGDRSIAGVDQAAYWAILRILRVSSFGPVTARENSGEAVDREALADRIQAYWDKNQGVPLVERWYRTLADDQAGASAWLEVAGNIVRPEEAPGPFPVEGLQPVPQPDERRFQGEALREGHSPTVSELLARRVQSVLNAPENQVQGPNQAMQIARHLATWDPDAAAPALRDLTHAYRERHARAEGNNGSLNSRNLAVWIAQLASLRAKIGDPSAFDEYAEWLKTLSFDPNDPFIPAILEPVLRNPQDPKLADAVDWLFNDPQSSWTEMMNQRDERAVARLAGMLTSSMMQIPAFKKMVREIALIDRAVVGEAEVLDNGQIRIRYKNNSMISGRSARDQDDPDAPPVGAKTPARARDVYAWRVAARGDAPHFNPCWPEAKRDAAIDKIIEFLKP